MGGRADESDGATLEVWEEDVLLCFVEAVDLIDEKDGGLAAEVLVHLRLGDFFPYLGDV